jgi:hypothetical protein
MSRAEIEAPASQSEAPADVRSLAHELCARSRREQGLPEQITDGPALASIAVLVSAATGAAR